MTQFLTGIIERNKCLCSVVLPANTVIYMLTTVNPEVKFEITASKTRPVRLPANMLAFISFRNHINNNNVMKCRNIQIFCS